MVSRGADGENLSIEMQYRMPITGRERLVTYGLEIGLEGKSPCIVREVLRYKRGAHESLMNEVYSSFMILRTCALACDSWSFILGIIVMVSG